PIMTPLADLVEISRQTAVLAYQYGDGFTNQIIPTSAALMGVLGMARMPYERWFKFIWPLMVFWIVAGSAMVFIAAVINYGPF
ncbi:MAG TPA: C4-dicarboxylate ABC transporter permease, partial [Synergistales bacterium]|nr:C4-dicarboxylate ABC transporter permease [Synergistales bacterium]